jgi:cobalt-zinc-cadmium efflux system outer membrane protein
VGIHSELALRRERVERIPNVTMEAGYTRDNIGRQDEWTFKVGVPVPIFNRNQGSIQSAQAELGQATQEVSRVENSLINRLATAYGEYAAARQRAERYRTSIRPVAQRAFKLSQEAFKGGQFEYLKVLQAQRSLTEADLEYNRALQEAWKAASQIAGLLLEEHWPESIIGPCDGLPRQ